LFTSSIFSEVNMRSVTLRNVTVVAMSLLVAGAAFGQGRQRADAMLDRADANGDGLISRDEFSAARAEQFASRDRNGDGFIGTADFGGRAAGRRRVSQAMDTMMSQLDANGDGKVSKEEFVAGGTKLFDRVDTDKSGALDKKEVEAAKANRQEMMGR